MSDIDNVLGLPSSNELFYPLNDNPAGYLNEVNADSLYYPISDNPAGYLTQQEVLEYINYISFPITGIIGTIYIALDTGLFYSWNGATYILSSPPNIGVIGVGLTDWVARWTSPTNIGIGKIRDNGVGVGINGAPLGGYSLNVTGNTNITNFLYANVIVPATAIIYDGGGNLGHRTRGGTNVDYFAKGSASSHGNITFGDGNYVTVGNETARFDTYDRRLGIRTILPTEALDVNGNIRNRGFYYDENNSFGTPGQILSSTATGTDWINVSSGGATPTFQQVLDNNHNLVDGNNFQGNNAGNNNSGGTNLNLFGINAANSNAGSDVNALGENSGNGNIGSGVNFFGRNAGYSNTKPNINAFGNGAGYNNVFKNVNLFGYNATADADNQTVFSKWVSGITKYLATLSFNNITTNRKWELPDASGTISLTSDIPTTATQVGALSINGDNATGNVDIGLNNFYAQKLSAQYGNNVSTDDYSVFETTNSGLYFVGNSGSDFDNFGYTELNSSAENGFVAKHFNLDGSIYNIETSVGDNIQKIVHSTSTDDAVITHTAEGISGTSTLKQTPYGIFITAGSFKLNGVPVLTTATGLSIDGSNAITDVNIGGNAFFATGIKSDGNNVLTEISTTASLASSTDRNYVTDVQLTQIGLGAKLKEVGSHSSTATAMTNITVTLATPQPDTSYQVNLTPTSLLASTAYYISAKTTGTFTITYATAVTGAINLDYTIYHN